MRTYKISASPAGIRLKLYDSGQEMGGGFFPIATDDERPAALDDASHEAEAYIGRQSFTRFRAAQAKIGFGSLS